MAQPYPHLPLRVSEPEDRHSPTGSIMVFDAAHNDIAEFLHSDQATVGQSYEQALSLANALVGAANSLAIRATEELREVDDLTWLRTQVLLLCEDTESRMAVNLEKPDLIEHERGFYKGSLIEAKGIRRAIAEVVRCRLADRADEVNPAREEIARIVFLALEDAAGSRMTPKHCQAYWEHWKHDRERAGKAWRTADAILDYQSLQREGSHGTHSAF